MLKSNAQSETVLATGPCTLKSCHPNFDSTFGTLPGEVLRPTTLQKLGGLRREPPMSLPSAKAVIPQATATDPPPVLPPQVFDKSNGLYVGPNTGLKV